MSTLSHSPPHRTWASILSYTSTYDHNHWKARDPVCSPIDKPVSARSVVGSVTTSESLVLYVLCSFFLFQCIASCIFHALPIDLSIITSTMSEVVFCALGPFPMSRELLGQVWSTRPWAAKQSPWQAACCAHICHPPSGYRGIFGFVILSLAKTFVRI